MRLSFNFKLFYTSWLLLLFLFLFVFVTPQFTYAVATVPSAQATHSQTQSGSEPERWEFRYKEYDGYCGAHSKDGPFWFIVISRSTYYVYGLYSGVLFYIYTTPWQFDHTEGYCW
jgi:hypothetical protein